MINGKCKKCGKMLHVDEDVLSFSCMYCGAKLSIKDILTIPENGSPKEAAQHFQYAMDHIVSCVTDHRGIMKHFTRDEYRPSFAKYRAACGKVFNELNSAAILDPSRREEYIRTIVDHFIFALESDWQKNPGWNKKKVKNEIIDQDKMIIAIYLVPLVGNLNLSISDDFSNTLQQTWVNKYPKNIFFVGSYDKITGSYDSKLKLCYITTAVCQSSGKPDNCYELETLRSFRDNWLTSSPNGVELIQEYYRIAPSIVCCMELTGGNYGEINDKYIRPCLRDIENGNMISCRDRYVNMVRSLENRFLA